MIDRLIADAARSLRGIKAGNPRFEAELLLARALERPRVFLFIHPEYRPRVSEHAAFAELLGRRLSGEPLQYVLGTAAFRNLTLRVGPGVLIPRSETEVLVGIAWKALHPRLGQAPPGAEVGQRSPGPRPAADPTGGRGNPPPPWVIDVGIGSGAILLALLDEARAEAAAEAGPLDAPGTGAPHTDPPFLPLGIDASPVALRYTIMNAELNHLTRPHLVCGDLLSAFSAVDPGAPVAAIVSNPPYVSTAEMAALPPEIREHEPGTALDGGPDGLDVIRELLDQTLAFIGRGALLCFEMGADQEEAVRRELGHRGLLDQATVHPDLAGRPRVVLVTPIRPPR